MENDYLRQRIGVFDYRSAVNCLRHNWEAAFPDEPFRDPQDAIQRMAAIIMEMRREITIFKEKR